MARRKAGAPIDLTAAHSLTAGLIADLTCPAGKQQAFLRDADCKGLRVRVTEAGAKSFVFESKVNGKTLRLLWFDFGHRAVWEGRGLARFTLMRPTSLQTPAATWWLHEAQKQQSPAGEAGLSR